MGGEISNIKISKMSIFSSQLSLILCLILKFTPGRVSRCFNYKRCWRVEVLLTLPTMTFGVPKFEICRYLASNYI